MRGGCRGYRLVPRLPTGSRQQDRIAPSLSIDAAMRRRVVALDHHS
jgi:hypothetical protein